MTQVRFMLVQSWRSTGLGYRVRFGVEIELGWGLKWDWDRGRSLNLGSGMARKEHTDIRWLSVKHGSVWLGFGEGPT